VVAVGQPEQATGSEAGRRHSWQEPKGRKDSRFRREDCEPQLLRDSARSWFVKKAITTLASGSVTASGSPTARSVALAVRHDVGQ